MRPLAGCRSGGVGSVNREARLPVMATDDSTLGIAAEWWEELREFRTTHRPKRVSVDGVGWGYIASGDGEEALLILSGGGDGRGGRFYPAFEGRYRVLEPSLDGVTLGPASTRSAALGTLPG
jgi:hypothetical protein